jgi:hypothetical protein
MAKSKKYQEVIDLGEKIVSEFGSEDRIDTLSRWMSHYIAQQIELIKNSSGRGRSAAESRCVEAILSLWRHRAFLPYNNRPFENFEKVFDTIQKLNSENPRSFYFERDQSIKESNTIKTGDKQLKRWLKVIEGIDRSTKVCLEHALIEAFNIASDRNTKDWIKRALRVDNTDEITLSRALFPANILTNENLSKELKTIKMKEGIEYRIKCLEDQIGLLSITIVQFNNELKKYTTNKNR